MKIHHSPNVGPLRKKAYPAIADQLDAVMKGFAHMQELGVALPAETLAWISQCQAVKTKYPKT